MTTTEQQLNDQGLAKVKEKIPAVIEKLKKTTTKSNSSFQSISYFEWATIRRAAIEKKRSKKQSSDSNS